MIFILYICQDDLEIRIKPTLKYCYFHRDEGWSGGGQGFTRATP
jgi:hypothetical protein